MLDKCLESWDILFLGISWFLNIKFICVFLPYSNLLDGFKYEIYIFQIAMDLFTFVQSYFHYL
jgi:hypothetical protein